LRAVDPLIARIFFTAAKIYSYTQATEFASTSSATDKSSDNGQTGQHNFSLLPATAIDRGLSATLKPQFHSAAEHQRVNNIASDPNNSLIAR